MSNTGQLTPATIATAGGVIPWTNPNNSVVTGTVNFATASPTTTDTTDEMHLTNLSASITAGSTINGVQFDFQCKATVSGTAYMVASLFNDPSFIGSTESTVTSITTTAQNFTLGGPSDVWGATLTQALVTSSTFGVAFVFGTGTNCTVSVNTCRVTIFYTAPGASTPSSIMLLGVGP